MPDTVVPLEKQITAVRRELRNRHHVYPRMVQRGTMSPQKMAEEILVMEAALHSLEQIAQSRQAA